MMPDISRPGAPPADARHRRDDDRKAMASGSTGVSALSRVACCFAGGAAGLAGER